MFNFNSESNQITNVYIIGILMIIINLGSRFIIEDFSPYQKTLINNSISRKIFILCVFLMATRNVVVSFILTFILFIIKDIIDMELKETKNEKKNKLLNDINTIVSKHII